jgi:hypothetical protein
MTAPGITDIYAFGEWLKRNYIGQDRKALFIRPIQGGLIDVKMVEGNATEEVKRPIGILRESK